VAIAERFNYASALRLFNNIHEVINQAHGVIELARFIVVDKPTLDPFWHVVRLFPIRDAGVIHFDELRELFFRQTDRAEHSLKSIILHFYPFSKCFMCVFYKSTSKRFIKLLTIKTKDVMITQIDAKKMFLKSIITNK